MQNTCMYVCMYLSIYLSFCLSIFLSVYMYINNGKIALLLWLLVCAIEILCVGARVGPTGERAQVKEGYSKGVDRDVDNHDA